MIDRNVRLSPHFTLGEACRSQTAVRLGIANEPPTDVAAALVRTAEIILEPCRAHFGVPFSPSSWFRCLELNRAIGSRDTSQHVKGQAVDIEIPGVANLDLARFVMAEMDYDQLILEFWDGQDPHAGWVHVSYVSAAENRRQALRFDGRSYRPGLEG